MPMIGRSGVRNMRSNKSMRYVYNDYDFYKECEPLIKEDMDDKQKYEMKKKIQELKREIEHLPIEVPQGVRAEMKIIPNGDGEKFVGYMDIMVSEQGLKEWEKFIKERGGAEQFIRDVLDERRERLIEKIKEIKMENTMKIDVRVLGKSGYHRVYSEGNELKCDCKLFERNGECHHVALVKTMLKEGKINENTKEVEPPMIVWSKDTNEIKYDKDGHMLVLPMEDKNPTLTIRMLHDYGYGLGAMREMHIVPRKFKLQQLTEVVHGATYEEAMDRLNEQELVKGMSEEQSQEMEMGA